jgi:hypothetical protein
MAEQRIWVLVVIHGDDITVSTHRSRRFAEYTLTDYVDDAWTRAMPKGTRKPRARAARIRQ